VIRGAAGLRIKGEATFAMRVPRPLALIALLAFHCGGFVAAAADRAGASLVIPLVEDPRIVGVFPTHVSAIPVESGVIRDAVWGTDYAAALDQARLEKKLVLLNFTGSDWCGWCRRLEADVFAKPEFKAYAAQRLVLVKVDFPQKKRLPEAEVAQNARLKRQYGIQGYPTIIVVDPTGRKVAELKGYVRGGPTAVIAAIEKQRAN
jgi:protein disulfide-isomerase